MVMCLFYRSFPEILPPHTPLPPTPNPHGPRIQRNRKAICCLLNTLKGPSGGGVVEEWGWLSTVPTGSQSRHSENPAFCFFSLFPTFGARQNFFFFFYFFLFSFFFEIFGVYLVFTSIWRRPGGNRLRHMFCQARSSRPIRVAKCWIRLITMQC